MPSTVESSATYQRLLVEGIREVATRGYTEEHERFNARKEFYREVSSDKAFEEFYSVNGVGDIPKFNGKLEALSGSPGFLTRIEPTEFAAKRMWERKFLENKQYDVMNDDSADMGIAAARTMNKYCGYPFVYATSASLEFMAYNEEGVALVSSSHTTKAGTSTTSGFSNTAALALTPTNLETVRLQGANIKSPISTRMGTNFDTLLVPNALAKTAWEITNTTTGLQSGEGTANYWKGKYNVIVWPFLDDYDTNDWYLIDSAQMKKDLLFIPRVEPEFKSNLDFETMVTALRVYFYFGLGYKGWRWLVKSTVS